ncbi:hypothetical protein Tco_0860209 [Tanacetum coccineum]|uniref:Uncharacterized protein n=1 Tax=Tanacetum coccineum TaxID=301880 RepID=A0ABQ5BHD8_9ASTR
MVKPVWNNAQRVNHQNFAKKTHPCAKKNLVPRAVLMKSGLVSVNTARQVNAAHSKTTVNVASPMSYLSKIAHLTVKSPIHKNTAFKNSNINQKGNPQMDLQDQGVLGITDLMITKPINRNEERRNKRKQDMLKKETRSRLMLIEININVEDID